MITGKINPQAYHIAEAVVNKVTGQAFLENAPVTQDLVDKANEELKKELIKREMDENMVGLTLEEGTGPYPTKIGIKFGASNLAGKGNKQVTFYDEIMK